MAKSALQATLRRWRKAATINVYRGLLIFLLGASPVLVRVALLTPVRAAASLGVSLALWRNWRRAALIWAKLPIPEVVRETIGADIAHFAALTTKGPIFRAAVRLLKRCVDFQRRPLAPSAVRVSAVRCDSAKVSWEPTVGSLLSDEEYRLELALLPPEGSDPPESAWRQLYSGPLCSHELRDLQPHTPCAARVCAHNDKGTSALKLAYFVTRQLPTESKGGSAPAYSWSQDDKEVIVRAPVPAGVRGADVLATATTSSLRVSLLKRGEGGGELVLLAGTLHRPIDTTEFAWQFTEPVETDAREAELKAAGGRVLEFTLPKADGGLGRALWPCVISAYAEPKPGRSPVALLLEHPRVDTSRVREAVPELGDHHLKELHEMMHLGAAHPGFGRAGDDDDE
jgi:HSP20 family molecular chaperone IbpA